MRSENQTANASPLPAEANQIITEPVDTQAQQLSDWLKQELESLEHRYADFITKDSNKKSFGR